MIDLFVESVSNYWQHFTPQLNIGLSVIFAAIAANAGFIHGWRNATKYNKVGDACNRMFFGSFVGFMLYLVLVPGLPIVLLIALLMSPAVVIALISNRESIANWAVEKKDNSSIISWITMQREVLRDSRRSAHKS